MKVSCNGCRVLRKGCSKNCTIRQCLQRIPSPEAQAHATFFLAKFYGRTGLLNLINSGPDHLRPDIFKSLLYEACGRIVNPICGSVGLLSSGSWPMVEAAVGGVLKGESIVSVPSDDATAIPVSHPTYDIRHLSKKDPDSGLHKVSKTTQTRFKRTQRVARARPKKIQHKQEPESSHNSSDESPKEQVCSGSQCEVSADTVDATSHVSQGEPVVESEVVGLDLMLGFGYEPTRLDGGLVQSTATGRYDSSSSGSTGSCSVSLELQLSL